MKFAQLIKNMPPKKEREIFSFKNPAENEVGRLVQDLVLIFKKALYKLSGKTLSFDIFLTLHLDTQ